MSVRRLLAATAATVLGAIGLAAPAAAHVPAQSAAVDAYSLTAGRLVGTTAALVALVGVAIGGMALGRSADRVGTGDRRSRAIVALVAGSAGVVVGALNLAVADGGPGTGNGVVGGASALVLGLIGTALGALALARSRRTT
ncbi:DUF6223 family protein [Streptomyces sp. NPDC006971]|uniref:DUF6223 family protein n=1 Tax=Streptomyces sp. NPDC006971 TaxID=3154784 RepID=UPI0033E6DAB5